MIKLDSIHFVVNGKRVLLYHYPSYSLISIGNQLYRIFKDLQRGEAIENISEKYNLPKTTIENDVSNIIKILDKNMSQVKKLEIINRKINRITLHISNDCNLRCKYCYANGGNYGAQRSLMNIQTAEDFVKFCIMNFDYIERIVFFGGEPCLNIRIMEYICKRFEDLYSNGDLNYIPKFIIITNGTIINDKLINLIKRYITYITVSIDGEEYLNDYNRIDATGKGSFKKISKFIDEVKQKTNAIIQFEATYTDFHVSEKVTKRDVYLYLKKRFGIEGTVLDELNIQKNKQIGFSCEDLDNIPDALKNILYALFVKQPMQLCQIAYKQFAISTTGDIYPCHMDVGNTIVSLGNIANENIFNDSSFNDKIKIRENINNKSILCPNCWAQNLCEGCSRMLFYDKVNNKYMDKPDKTVCRYKKNHIEKILLSIAELRENKDKWEQFVFNMNERIKNQ